MPVVAVCIVWFKIYNNVLWLSFANTNAPRNVLKVLDNRMLAMGVQVSCGYPLLKKVILFFMSRSCSTFRTATCQILETKDPIICLSIYHTSE